MRVVLLSNLAPFVTGGAEALARNLARAIEAAGHEAQLVELPFKWYPAEALWDAALFALLAEVQESFGARTDRMIGLKFPAWLAPHPDTVLWVIHQHRQAYDLWEDGSSDLIGQPRGQAARELVRALDAERLTSARAVYTIAGTVSDRLHRFCGVAAPPLYSPPEGAEHYAGGDFGDYLFFPSRLSGLKRQDLALEALARTRTPARLVFAGAPDEPATAARLEARAQELGVAERVVWHGRVAEADKRALYADATAVLYPPRDEDYGYVTLEAMLAQKPVITTEDAGGPLEFVLPGETGLITEPSPEALAGAIDRLWDDRAEARRLGAAGRDRYAALPIGWDAIVEALLG